MSAEFKLKMKTNRDFKKEKIFSAEDLEMACRHAELKAENKILKQILEQKLEISLMPEFRLPKIKSI